jgi:hypothetical protein
MIKIAFALLLAAAVLPAEFCACVGCFGFAHREAPGKCTACAGPSSSIDDKLCVFCASKTPSCAHCGKPLRQPQVLVGEVVRVDKQPRADLTYFVCRGEDGKPQGIYARRQGTERRALLFIAQDDRGDYLVREWFSLDPKEKDLSLTGASAGPVCWRVGSVKGPDTAVHDGTFKLVLPALPGWMFEVVSGDKVLSRHRFENGAWKELR